MTEKIESESMTKLEPVISFTEEDLEDKNKHVLTVIASPGGKEVEITNNVDIAMKFAIEHKGKLRHWIQLLTEGFYGKLICTCFLSCVCCIVSNIWIN